MALSLNTKAKGEFDFKKISVDEFIPEYTVDEALLTKDIERILKAQGTKIEASDVIEGDMVTISCESEIPKYSKNGIVVPVGKGMFSKELEEQLIGKRVGQAFLASVEGKEVSVNIEKSIRTIPAELTDEVVAGFGMEGIASLNDLKRYCIDKQLDKILDDYEPLELASAKVWKEFGKMVEVIFDEDEKQRAYDRADARVAQMEQPQFESEEERLTYEQEYKEEFGEERAGIDTTEFMRNIAVMELKLAAFGFEYVKGTEKELTEADYEAKLQKWMAYHENLSEEEVRKLHPIEDYIIETYAEIICSKIDQYTIICFKNKMNPLR